MTDRRAGPCRRSYNTDKAVAHLVADNDSDIEQISSETGSISDEEIYLELNYNEKKQRTS